MKDWLRHWFLVNQIDADLFVAGVVLALLWTGLFAFAIYSQWGYTG